MNSNERPNLQKTLNKKAEGGVLILTFFVTDCFQIENNLFKSVF